LNFFSVVYLKGIGHKSSTRFPSYHAYMLQLLANVDKTLFHLNRNNSSWGIFCKKFRLCLTSYEHLKCYWKSTSTNFVFSKNLQSVLNFLFRFFLHSIILWGLAGPTLHRFQQFYNFFFKVWWPKATLFDLFVCLLHCTFIQFIHSSHSLRTTLQYLHRRRSVQRDLPGVPSRIL